MNGGKLRDGLIQRTSGKWAYVVRVTDPETGLTKPKWHGGYRTMDEAKKARDAARVAVQRGEYRDRSAVTVGEYLAEWIDGHAVGLAPSTAREYRRTIARDITPRIGRIPLQHLRASTVKSMYADLASSGGHDGRGRSSGSLDRVRRVLVRGLRDAVDVDGVIPVNPAAKVRPAARAAQPVDLSDLWNPRQLSEFLAGVRDDRMGAFLHLAAFTGARRGELLALEWPDVDLDAATMTVRRSVTWVDGVRLVKTPKSGKSRGVALDPATVAVLRQWRRRQRADRLALGQAWQVSRVVFTREDGVPIHEGTPIQALRRVSARLGLPRIRLHDLRHIHATTLLRAGVPAHVVAQRLGHSSPVVTLSVYAHALPGDSEVCAKVFANAVSAGA